METATTVSELRARVRGWHGAGERVGLVPTMGALHNGHMSLVTASRSTAKRSIVSLFVNPRQFAPNEDLATYPRDLERDHDLLHEAGVDLLYAPGLEQIYPDGFATTVSVAGPAEGLEGSSRPGFFNGVATVVTKLFTQSAADIAVFGEKDYQQLLVVKRFVRDLDLPIDIIGMPTVREADGLACSSRNDHLDPVQRETAPQLFAILTRVASELPTAADPGALLDAASIDLKARFDTVDYLTWRDSDTLEPDPPAGRDGRLLAAVKLGTTRLIDNVAVAPRHTGDER